VNSPLVSFKKSPRLVSILPRSKAFLMWLVKQSSSNQDDKFKMCSKLASAMTGSKLHLSLFKMPRATLTLILLEMHSWETVSTSILMYGIQVAKPIVLKHKVKLKSFYSLLKKLNLFFSHRSNS
jgi:hypothetical protein